MFILVTDYRKATFTDNKISGLNAFLIHKQLTLTGLYQILPTTHLSLQKFIGYLQTGIQLLIQLPYWKSNQIKALYIAWTGQEQASLNLHFTKRAKNENRLLSIYDRVFDGMSTHYIHSGKLLNLIKLHINIRHYMYHCELLFIDE